MKTKTTALLLAVVICFTAFSAAVTTTASAATMYGYMTDFLDTVGPMCTNDMRDNHILASFTLAQAIWESGWGRSTLAKEANNLFGIRASSNWDGMVYDRNECVLYDSWADLVTAKGNDYIKQYTTSFWRAYPSWQESVNDHSGLFNKASRYENLRGNYDYKSCCELVVADGYCNDAGYAEKLISTIEAYDLEQYNYDFGGTVTPPVGGDNGADTLGLKPAVIYMEKGVSFDLSVSVSPAEAEYSLTSSNTSVAKVEGTRLTAVSDGTATLTLASGSLKVKCSVTVKSGYGGIVADGVYLSCVSREATVVIPAEATSIAAGAFKGSSVQTIVVGQGVKTLDEGAFTGITGGFSLCSYGNSAVSSFAAQHAIECANVSVGWYFDTSSTISGISAYTTANLVSMYYSIEGISATVKGSDGKILAGTDYVGTGCLISMNGKDYSVCIKGDLDGNGILSSSDLIKLKMYLGGNNDSLPSRPFRRAADYNSDERITTADYLRTASALRF